MRWRVWMIVASCVASVVRASAVRSKNRRIETALVVSSAPWSITFSRVVRADDRCRDLDAARAPAARQRHFARAERDLIAGDGDGLEQSTADHPLRLLVEIGVIIGGRGLPPALILRRSRRLRRERWCGVSWGILRGGPASLLRMRAERCQMVVHSAASESTALVPARRSSRSRRIRRISSSSPWKST